jgi:eukaryotic-like serine/threonine-protein kinase
MPDRARRQKVELLCLEALTKDGASRVAFLDAGCAGDSALRREVDELLAGQSEAAAFLETPAWADSPALRTLRPGTRLGPYTIEGLIGAGGMGEVYLAEDTRLNRRVAIKRLPAEFAADTGRLARLEREARLLAQLEHPNIAALHALEEAAPDGTGAPVRFLVMQLAEGETLKRRIEVAGRIPVDEALGIARQVAAALEAAHDKGVVHRDLKPANVMVAGDGRVKVVDFGIAKNLGSGLDATADPGALTAVGALLGTVAYMSPEQGRGQETESASDVWAFGCLLFEMLTGVRAFEGHSAVAVIATILNGTPDFERLPREVPAGLRSLIRQCLEKRPDRRPPSGRALGEALARIETRRAGALSGRRRGLTAAAVLVALALAGVGWWRWSSPALPQVTSLAVLPLENRSSSAVPDFFAEGMTDELILQLQRISALRVRSRTSASAYKGSGKRLPEIARELDVDAILEGSVDRSDDRVRITVRLIGAKDEAPLWDGTYERDLRDALALQREVAIAVATGVDGMLTPDGAAGATRASTVSPEVLDLFFRGRHLRGRHNRDDLVVATAVLERAVQLDPQFARAHGALALAYVLRAFNFEPDREAELTASAEAAAARALALDPGVADAHVARGRLLWTRRNGFPHLEAAREFRRAIELNPGSATALGDLALVYNHIGLPDLALAAIGDALAIDPSENRALLQMGLALLSQGRAAEALGVLRRLPPGFLPSFVVSHEAWALLVLGRSDEAEARVDRALEEFPADQGGELAAIKAFLAARDGQHRVSEALIAQARQNDEYGHFHHTAYFITWAYARMGQTEVAVEWLRDTARLGWLSYPLFARDPHLDPLRGDPRFEAVLQDIRAEWERYRTALASDATAR